jgi:hypothetical protein
MNLFPENFSTTIFTFFVNNCRWHEIYSPIAKALSKCSEFAYIEICSPCPLLANENTYKLPDTSPLNPSSHIPNQGHFCLQCSITSVPRLCVHESVKIVFTIINKINRYNNHITICGKHIIMNLFLQSYLNYYFLSTEIHWSVFVPRKPCGFFH